MAVYVAVPHLEFCSTVLYGLPAYKINQIQIVQNRELRKIQTVILRKEKRKNTTMWQRLIFFLFPFLSEKHGSLWRLEQLYIKVKGNRYTPIDTMFNVWKVSVKSVYVFIFKIKNNLPSYICDSHLFSGHPWL